MKSNIYQLVVALVAVTAGALQAEPVYPVYPVAQPPKIDGRIDDDAAWRTIPWAAGFHKIGKSDFRTLKQTTFKMAYDRHYIYVAVHCDEPDIANVKGSIDYNPSMWREDCTEVLIQPKQQDVYRQYIINPNGARLSASRSESTGVWSDGSPFDQWQVSSYRGDRFWSFELAIPFDAIGKTPAAEEQWRANVCRSIQTFDSGGDNLTTWSPMRKGYHEVNRYGTLVFFAEPISQEEAIEREQQINAAYRSYLIDWTRKLASHTERHQRSLAAAEKISAYQQTAAHLKKQLTAVQASAALTDAPLSELIATYRNAFNLDKAVVELEARSILDGLFE